MIRKTFLTILPLLAATLILSACGGKEKGGGSSTEPEDDTYVLSPFKGTKVRDNTADPCLVYQNGIFYLTMTGTENVALVFDTDLSKLGTSLHPNTNSLVYRSAEDPSVEEFFGEGAVLNGTWSPELHYFSEEECPGNSGWYLYFALRLQNEAGNSADVRTVVLKSLSNRPSGPYAGPVDKVSNHTQALLDKDWNVIEEWTVGPSVLRIPSGKYKGTYLTWVDEVGRGMGLGNFYQRLRIAKMGKPWQLASEASTITTPTQDWEKKGASSTHPWVVEGGTAVYGDHGEIYLAYCGSGYWSDYGLGQLTLKMENGDYADPLKTESWIKYANNPVFSSVSSESLRGAGHASFIKDDKGNRFMCYHSYTYISGEKSEHRNAYIEPYTIDYHAVSETAPLGVLRMGLLGNGVAAPTYSNIEFYINAKYRK